MTKATEPRFLPMEARPVAALPEGPQWRYEPKWDGFRCLAFKEKGRVTLRSKSGKPLDRYFPDIVAVLEKVDAEDFVLDGELLIEVDGVYSFAELQLRLHPAASRVRKLAEAHPATFMLFDMPGEGGKDFRDDPLSARRGRLEAFHRRYAAREKHLALSPRAASLVEAQAWIEPMKGRIDGLIAKDDREIYRPEERAMQKYKFIRTADCVVGGFRYGTNSKQVGSLLLGLYDEEGKLNHVGFTSAIAAKDRPEVTRMVEKRIGGSGFTGKAPGGPSRWASERSTRWESLKPDLVVEVSFDHVSEDRFRHGTRFVRWRPDKAPQQCTMEQLRQPRLLA